MGAAEMMRERDMRIKNGSRQSQNDIKKLRRENEQLRREIWSLRDEYDKLEEILKKQKSREESDETEGRSEIEAAGSEYSEDEDDEEEDDDEEDDEEPSESDDEANDHEARQENAENQKISSEKPCVSPLQHRTLPVVHEEEEPKRENKDQQQQQPFITTVSVEPVATGVMQQPAFPHYHTTSFEQPYPMTTTNFSYPPESPFVFPAAAVAHSTNATPMTTYPQVHHHQQQQQAAVGSRTSSFEVGTFEHPQVASTPPPPPGWQSGLTARSVSPLNFAGPAFPPLLDVGPTIKPPEEFRAAAAVVAENAAGRQKSLSERRRAFFKHYTDADASTSSQRASGSRWDNGDPTNKGPTDPAGRSRLEERSIDDAPLDASTPNNNNNSSSSSDNDSQTRHFFAPLPAKYRSSCNGEAAIVGPSLDDDFTMASHSDNGNSPSSEKTGSTVISRGRYEKAPLDNGNASSGAVVASFFPNENYRPADNAGQTEFYVGDNLLTKSLSCQDLNSRMSFVENLSWRNEQLAKSDSTLDSMSIKAFKSQLNITLRQPGSSSRKSLSPDTPEIPKLPSIDYKLFNNPFLQNFEQAYQNFPMRTEGQSPLALQVCESPVSGAGYSSPVRMQPTFTSPNEPEYAACKRKDLERLRLMIPSSNKMFDVDRQEYQVTSFENPSPRTLQIPPMTPYELEALRRMPTGTTPLQGQSPMTQTPRLYQNVPFTPGMRHDSSTKISTMTQTSPEAQPQESSVQATDAEQPKKRRSRKDKTGSIKDKGGSIKRRSPSSARRSKEQLKKQSSVASSATAKDIPETPRSRRGSEQQDKNESRSSSSGQESPKKELASGSSSKRVSLYFSARKRPSLTSSRTTSRSRSVENSRHLGRSDNHLLESNRPPRGPTPSHERERTNSISSREARDKQQRRTSTSSGSVPWCACWGNGCI